jgi:hypothetical protein
VLTNTTSGTIHARSVSSSCKCATPTLKNDSANPGEQIVVEVAYNATTFYGERSMSIYVTFDAPTYETVSLRVRGYSRHDIVFEPGTIDFGVLSQPLPQKRTMRIEHTGSQDWRIESIDAPAGINASFVEKERSGSRVSYELTAAIESERGPGTLSQIISLKTNSSESPQLSVPVVAVIEAPISISPSEIDLGTLRVGEKVTRKGLIRAQVPFRIVSVSGDTADAQVNVSSGDKTTHLFAVDYAATKAGKIDQRIQVNTTLENVPAPTIRVTAEVVE